MGGIFISYRRDDSGPYAGRLRDALSRHFGTEQVFRDINTVNPGERFHQVVEQEIRSCGALLAVIGPTWLSINDGAGQRRLDHPDDYVRLEIAAALERWDLLVIPVLVGSSSMPAVSELPKALASLAERNAVRLSDEGWDDQVGRLIKALEKVVHRHVAPSIARVAAPKAKAGLPSPDAVGEGAVVVGEIPRAPQAFVPRATVRRLADALSGPGVAVVCALTGLRGVGKTQVAAAYARSSVDAGDGLVGWVNAESRDDLLAGLARIAARVGVADPDGDSLKSAQRLREHLETRTGAAVVVFDNAVDPDALLQFLPAAGTARIVITSTDRAFTELGQQVDVDAFSRAESVAYLRQRTEDQDANGAAELAAELGDLPVALAQAAATIRGQRLTYQRYLDRLRRVSVAELLGPAAGQGYRHATAAALLLSIENAEGQNPSGLTGTLLRLVAVLPAEGVSRELLSTLQFDDIDEEGAIDTALGACVRGSLLSWSVGGDSVIMHRLVGRILCERDRASGRWPATLANALDLLEPQLFDKSRAWTQRHLGSELVSQVEALWDVTNVEPADRSITARELRARSWGVRQLCAAADLTRSLDLGVRVAADSERFLGADDPQTLTARHDLASAYWWSGRLAEATALNERTLSDRERVLGSDHPDTLASLSNLAGSHDKAGRLKESVALHERTLSARERVLGSEHPDTLKSRHNLADAYQVAGRYAEAIALLESAVTDRGRVIGAEHPDTLLSRHDLAIAYESVGRVAQAIDLHERTLTDRERVLGADHPKTLESRQSLAVAYRSAGLHEKAIALLERTLDDNQNILGADHPQTLTSRNDLAAAYRSVGHHEKAIALLERTVTDRDRILGAEHPDTLTSRNNLAYAYWSAGRLQEAIALLEHTLTARETILGAEHPDTLTSRDNLAGLYTSTGRHKEAIALLKRNVLDCERILGADHPDTLTTRNNLAATYQSAGLVEQAFPLFEGNVLDSERVLGADHPDTLRARKYLATAYQSAGRAEEAFTLFERTLTDRERVLGADHPQTMTSRDDLAGAHESARRLQDAIELFERNLTDRERILGKEHPDTLASRRNLARAYESVGRLAEAIPSYERTASDCPSDPGTKLSGG